MLARTSISIPFSDTKALATGVSDDSGVFVFASNCMDHRRSDQDYRGRPRLYPQHSASSLHASPSPSRRQPAPYSSPLPQTQWAEVPLPYRPRNWPESADEVYESYETAQHDPTPAWCLRPPESPYEIQTAQAGAEARRRRRVRGVRSIFTGTRHETQHQPVDASMLYPQVSPYEDRMSTYSAPEDLEHFHVRALLHPEPSGYPIAPSRNVEPYPTSMPRSPTYPPVVRRRGHSSAGAAADHAFDDPDDFHLFVQATAGLGPDVTFRPAFPMPQEGTARWRSTNDVPILQRPSTTGDITIPPGETPTMMYALQQVPQMPESHQHSLPRRERQGSITPGLDLWLNNPQPAMAEFEEITPVDEIDEELPDYAESQAQAQAHQRSEAARRAQELARRWQMSGSRRGI